MIINIQDNDVNLVELETQVQSTDGLRSEHLEVWQSTAKFLQDFPDLSLPLNDGFYGFTYEPDAGFFCVLHNDGDKVECKETVSFSPVLTWVKENEAAIKQYAINLRIKELDGTRGAEE